VIRGEWLLATGEILSVAFGVLLFPFPGDGALAMVLWIAAFAIVFGATMTALGLKLRKLIRGQEGSGFAAGQLAPGH